VGQRYDPETETLIPSHGGGFDVTAFAIQDVRGLEKSQGGRGWNDDGSAYTLDTWATQGVATISAVRRLTPIECERLQGFPDNFTAIPWRNKSADDCPDGPRYKALGNSMAVPVMNWIGRRINEVEKFNGSKK
jgi:DNA (cytosine-5)-methyltransferase 1